MSESHLCPQCGGWHPISVACAGRASANPFHGIPALPPAQRQRRQATTPAAQSNADCAEAAAIAAYLRLFRSGEATA